MSEPTNHDPTGADPASADLVPDSPSAEVPSDPGAPFTEAQRSPRSKPSPTAQAATRARRIGGRPMPGPRASTQAGEPAVLARTSAEQAPASVGQPTRPKPATAPQPVKTPKPARPKDPQDAGRRADRLGEIALALAAAAVAVMLGLGVWLTHGVWWSKPDTNTRRSLESQQVLAAAKTCTAAILSYNYLKLGQAEAAGQACSTGQLRADYTRLMDTTVKQIAPQNKVTQVFQVSKAGITRVSPDGKQWVVLVYGQQSVTSSTTTAGGRLDISSASVTLNQVGTGWFVSNMTTTS